MFGGRLGYYKRLNSAGNQGEQQAHANSHKEDQSVGIYGCEAHANMREEDRNALKGAIMRSYTIFFTAFYVLCFNAP